MDEAWERGEYEPQTGEELARLRGYDETHPDWDREVEFAWEEIPGSARSMFYGFDQDHDGTSQSL